MASPEVVFILTRDDVIGAAREMGIAEQAITDEVLEQVKNGVSWGLEYWPDVVKASIDYALKN